MIIEHIIFVTIGAILLFWAGPLSIRYKAWTSTFREHNPQINPPPTPEWRRRNTTIFAWILRLVGLTFFVLDGLALIGSAVSHSK